MCLVRVIYFPNDVSVVFSSVLVGSSVTGVCNSDGFSEIETSSGD